jgi:hypothetical protein
VKRNTAEAISEFIAFMLLVTAVGCIAPLTFLFLFVVNSIAGTVITDLNLNKAVVFSTREIENNKVSLVWGLKKMVRNNLWWR